MLGYARDILRLSDDASDRLRDSRLQGRVRLGVSEHAAINLPPLLSRFAGCHPQVRLSAEVGTSSTLLRRLREGRLDLAIASAPQDATRCTILFEDEIVWAGAPDFDAGAHASLPLVAFSKTCRLRRAATQLLDEADRRCHVVFWSASLTGILAAATAGLGLATLFRQTLGPGLVEFGAADDLPALPAGRIALHRKPGHPRRAVQTLDEFIVDHFQPHSQDQARQSIA
jgi:DNA-binding transcriptional LysR family regulator